ncbi:Thymidylate kinase [Planctomycetes bacterium CA13]|uniref:Thymidylate kinase n=1 Tax=Novipirellula herctigrandis TaxID=2527986 RepID=A0A5C5YZE8_9BACT|nr:Thymidylate kinase [Planctomycetes bacterium CA13]
MSVSAPPGIFIVVDGIDGAGKSTQVDRFREQFELAGRETIASKEPTDGPWGRRIRDSAVTGRMSLEDELSAFIEDRREHVAGLIRPSVAAGKIVIVDRYFYSTVAYQGLRGADTDELLKKMRAEFPIPDVTLFFDLPVPVALKRISENRGDTPNEFEHEAALRQIRDLFDHMANVCPEVEKIDCSSDPDEVTQAIARTLLRRLSIDPASPLAERLGRVASGAR